MTERGGLVLTHRGSYLAGRAGTYLNIVRPGHVICGCFAAVYGLPFGRRRKVIAGCSLPILHFDIEGRLSRVEDDWGGHQMEGSGRHIRRS